MKDFLTMVKAITIEHAERIGQPFSDEAKRQLQAEIEATPTSPSAATVESALHMANVNLMNQLQK